MVSADTEEKALIQTTEKLDLNFDELVRLDEVPALNQNLGIAVNRDSAKALVNSLQKAYKQLENKDFIADHEIVNVKCREKETLLLERTLVYDTTCKKKRVGRAMGLFAMSHLA